MLAENTHRRPYLRFKESQDGKIFPLDKETVTLGRAEDNDIVISHTQASRYHARIKQNGRSYVIEDLGSTNGTFVNRRRLHEPLEMRNDDTLQIADKMLVFVDPDVTASPIRIPSIDMDEDAAEIWIGEREIKLSPKEYALLRYLFKQQGKVVSKDILAEQVWPEYQGGVSDYNIESLVSRLRDKIEPDPSHPVYLTTLKKRGYKLVSRPEIPL